MKNFRLWLTIACVFQLLTGLIHSISFVAPAGQPANETEKQLMNLFENYKQDMGAGYFRTTAELFTSISACLTLLYIFGGLLNWHFLRKNRQPDFASGFLNIQVFVYGVAFVVMLFFAFLPPIILTGLSFLFVLVARVVLAVQKPAS